MPNAEGVTAMSAYIIVCILFVFGALCAYAFLLWRLKPTVLFKVPKASTRATRKTTNLISRFYCIINLYINFSISDMLKFPRFPE